MREAGATVVDPVTVPGAAPLRTSEDELTVLLYEFHDGIDRYLSARAGRRGRVRVRSTRSSRSTWSSPRRSFRCSVKTSSSVRRAPVRSRLGVQTGAGALRRAVPRQGDRPCARQRASRRARRSTTGPAWLIDHVNGDSFLGAGYSIAAVAGYPSITVPIGTVSGLPVGLSLLGGRGPSRSSSRPVGLEAELAGCCAWLLAAHASLTETWRQMTC